MILLTGLIVLLFALLTLVFVLTEHRNGYRQADEDIKQGYNISRLYRVFKNDNSFYGQGYTKRMLEYDDETRQIWRNLNK